MSASFFEEHGLTKRTRVRTERRFMRSDLMVVQVETHGFRISNIGGRIDTEYANRWRDARVEDFVVPELPPLRPDAAPA